MHFGYTDAVEEYYHVEQRSLGDVQLPIFILLDLKYMLHVCSDRYEYASRADELFYRRCRNGWRVRTDVCSVQGPIFR